VAARPAGPQNYDEEYGGEDGEPELVPAEELDLSGMVCESWQDGYVYCEPEGAKGEAGDGDYEDEYGTDFDQLIRDLPQALSGAWPHSGTPFEVVGSSGVALLVLALCLLAPRVVRRLLYPVAAAGTMALTLYAAHALVLKYVEYEDMNRLFWFCVLGALVFAVLWRRWRRQGPAEWLMSTVSQRASSARVRGTAPSEVPAPRGGGDG
jgi:hypothetical protein